MPKRVELNAHLLDLDKMLRRMIGEDIELVFLPGAEAGAVRVDPGQLESAILNLAVNARDAMPEGGTLTITTGRHVEAGRPWARITVADTGSGITPEARATLFEPFHSTRDGTSGLGLASVYGFVEQSGGRIDVQSAPGTGTSFVIDLPALAEEDVAEPGPARGHVPVEGETILLAEDNPRARRGIAAMLRQLGYTVLEAEHGEDALRVSAAHHGPIALLLSDVVMPTMKVTTLVERLRAARPETRVLLMSGYTDDALVRAGVQEGHVAFLPKPFTAEVLAAKLHDVLDGSGWHPAAPRL
jgi:CheY-like chemotaxis protein